MRHAGRRRRPLDEVAPSSRSEPERSSSSVRRFSGGRWPLVVAGIGVMFAMRDARRRRRRSRSPFHSRPGRVCVGARGRCTARSRRGAPSALSVAPALVTSVAPLPATASLEDVVSRILPAVGSITAGQSRGTGFFIRPDQVLTNAHVVQGHTSVTLQVGSTTYSARVTTVSTGSDLALLQVYNANPNQPVLPMGSVSRARVGQEVIAVGSALGVLSNTVTRGIVSAVQAGRQHHAAADRRRDQSRQQRRTAGRSLRSRDRHQLAGGRGAGRPGTRVRGGDRSRRGPVEWPGEQRSSQTPLTALTKAMGGPSDSDQSRARGEQSYAQVDRVGGSQQRAARRVLGQVRRLLRLVLIPDRRSAVVRGLRTQRRAHQPDVVAQLSELARHAAEPTPHRFGPRSRRPAKPPGRAASIRASCATSAVAIA